jgi:hypothetical protein
MMALSDTSSTGTSSDSIRTSTRATVWRTTPDPTVNGIVWAPPSARTFNVPDTGAVEPEARTISTTKGPVPLADTAKVSRARDFGSTTRTPRTPPPLRDAHEARAPSGVSTARSRSTSPDPSQVADRTKSPLEAFSPLAIASETFVTCALTNLRAASSFSPNSQRSAAAARPRARSQRTARATRSVSAGRSSAAATRKAHASGLPARS